MLKFAFKYLFYIIIRRIFGMMTQFCYGVYNSVVQPLWFAYADKTKKYSKRIYLVPAEPSTIYGGSTVLLAVQKL